MSASHEDVALRQHALPLVLPRRVAMGREDFVVSPANAEAVALIDAWRRWPERRLALAGPAGSGKTHLAHVFMAESGARVVSASALRTEDAPALVEAGAAVVEDVDGPDGLDERALFHLMNLAAAEGAALLVTGRGAPARWPAALPDLASRLSALTPARLSPPDDALLAAVIAKGFVERGLAVSPAVPTYLAARIERTFAAAEAAVAQLDAAALAAGRPVTRGLAREMLG